VLMDGTNGAPAQPLWPWPMEERIRAELGVSVTNLVAGIIPDQVERIPLGAGPYFRLSPAFTTFGGENPDKRTITLTNPSETREIRIMGFSFGGSYASTFQISNSTCPATPFTLGPSQSCNLEVSFITADSLAKWGLLSVVSPDTAPYPFPPTVWLHGLGKSLSTTKPPSAPTNVTVISVQPNN